jgi:MFS family permease
MNSNKALFFASFMTLIAAGVGFAIRGGILGDLAGQFGFTQFELGTITGGGLLGFGITIIIGSIFADQIGFKPLMITAFILHLASAVVTLAATPVFVAFESKDATYWCLWIGALLFALANGVCESVINPLVATLYPKQKTHYLNILHAGWPGGLVLGGLLAYCFVGEKALITQLRWEIPMSLFLIPTVIYGLIMLRERFPHSEAKAAGVSLGTMVLELASPILLLLFFLHACVGYVELGTDSWITDIMKAVIGNNAFLLFVYTSTLMFVLRFFAGPIVERINPVGLLFVSACLGCIGLYWLGIVTEIPESGEIAVMQGVLIVLAATTYGIGKTFLWPTMLGVVGERFPKGGSLTMGMIGGIGMLSAGLIGAPAIGFKQDYNASNKLKSDAPDSYQRYVAEEEKSFLGVFKTTGLDGAKVKVLDDEGKDLAKAVEIEESKPDEKKSKTIAELASWWEAAEEHKSEDREPVTEAKLYGGRKALQWTAAVPLIMAIGYLILVLYFMSKGGYRVEVLHGAKPDGEKYTGGVEGPVE